MKEIYYFIILPALLLPLIMESFIIFPLFRHHCNSTSKLVINFILINAITNLSLIALFLLLMTTDMAELPFLLMLSVPLIEASMFSYSGVKKSLKSIILTCYIANILSFVIGLILVYLYLYFVM